MRRILRIPDYNRNYLFFIGIHVLIGFLIHFNRNLAKPYFIACLIFFIWRVFTVPNKERSVEILKACAYFAGAEVLFRMTRGGLAYEASKYLVIAFMTIGIILKGVSGKAYPYFIYLILLVPAVIVASITLTFDANFRTNIAFVLSGPVCLGIAALFCYDRKFTQKQLIDVMLYLLLPCIAMTTYLFFYSPTIRDQLTGTASNYAASGFFGPNQVSTALGMGMFAVAIRFFMVSPTLKLKIINMVILFAMAYRALITFSRGGVFTAIIIIAAFLFILFQTSGRRVKQQIVFLFALFIMGTFVTWAISVTETRGLLEKRYQNQDSLGREKGDITTGRVDLFMEEVEGFLSSPFLGIGASRIKNSRVEELGQEINSHNEIGRTLSEHGFFGIIIILILILKPLVYRTTHRNNIFFYSFLGFWFATINHSGMRIAAPALLYAFSLLNITIEKPPIHRKLSPSREV